MALLHPLDSKLDPLGGANVLGQWAVVRGVAPGEVVGWCFPGWRGAHFDLPDKSIPERHGTPPGRILHWSDE